MSYLNEMDITVLFIDYFSYLHCTYILKYKLLLLTLKFSHFSSSVSKKMSSYCDR